MNESPEGLAAVEQLLAESDALRGWLARLEHASASAPSTVRDRVRSDYQRRLDDLTAGLRAHGDVIAAKLSDDRAEHDALAARAQAAHDALAEAELRHLVGEYDDDRFDRERAQHAGDIETFDLSLRAVTERIDRLSRIHGMVTDGARPLAVDEPPDQSTSQAIETDQPPTAAEAPPASAAMVEDDDDQLPVADEPVGIADLAPDLGDNDFLSVFDEQVIAVEVDDEPTERPAQTVTPEVGPLSFRPTGAGGGAAPPARPRSFESTPPLGMPADQPPRFVRPGERMSAPAPAAAPPATAPREPAPAVNRPAPTPDAPMPTATQVHEAAAAMQVGRTLRCAECGAMNRPLEWYCEKCGAELMAM